MKIENLLRWLGWLWLPIRKNSAFFVFMFALGWLCTELELMPVYLVGKGAKPYELAMPELLLDLYALCVVLTLIPEKVRRWVRALLYVLFYGVALADVFCYVKLRSTLTPTMLMLVSETNQREAGEFFSSYLDWSLLTSDLGWILLLIMIHILWSVMKVRRREGEKARRRILLPRVNSVIVQGGKALIGIAVGWLLAMAIVECWDNKTALQRLFSQGTIGEVERELTRKDKATLYLPVYRLAFALYANNLADQQIEQVEVAEQQIVVDSCSYRVPEIVLVIGESYNKHHSQLYGYDKPTTPRQMALQKEGSLVAFSDVVAPWNLTSYVFKNLLSLQAVGDSGQWSDKPLFPEVFRKAGYHVTFITNQFLSTANEAVYDFSGGFFLNDSAMSQRLFDTRNSQTHRYDDGVIRELDSLQGSTPHNLIILHLMGSHMDYRGRYPQKTRSRFKPDMYDREDLTPQQLKTLAEYDNSILYNDSIVAVITQRYVKKDALVIYMPDHGEEIFDDEPVSGRLHSDKVDYRLARNEMEIPFWIWGSPLYREKHPYGWQAIQGARDRRLMTDVLSHLLLYLGGISTPLYREEYNVIMPGYDENRPRLLKGKTEYDKLRR